MLLIPSIDLRGGHCVRLLKGEFHAETRYEIDPRALLERYADHGVRWLHLVDLDGARDGTPGNQKLIGEMAAQARVRIQLGGGLRTREAGRRRRLPAGVSRVGHRQCGGGEPGTCCASVSLRVAPRACASPSMCAWMPAACRACARAAGSTSMPLSLWELLAVFADTTLAPCAVHRCRTRRRAAGTESRAVCRSAAPLPADTLAGLRWHPRCRAISRVCSSMGIAAAISGKALLEGRITMEELQPYLPAA